MVKKIFNFSLIFIIISLSQPIYSIPKQVCNISIPKSGTGLLTKLVQLMHGPTCMTISKKVTPCLLKNMNINVIHTHATFEKNIKLFAKYINKFAFIFIYRDPRDQIVSHAYWIKKTKDPAYLASKSIEDLITHLIKNNIVSLYNLYLPWTNFPGIHITTFEKLIGPQGGGSSEQQYIEIDNIAKHAGFNFSSEKIDFIAKNLFSNNNIGTFREGKIGSWKTHFTADQKNLFKELAGELLIKLGYETDLNW